MKLGSLVVVMAAVLLAAVPVGCKGKITSDKDLAFVNPDAAEEMIQGRKRLLGLGGQEAGIWVDPRGEEAFREGHIPGALNMPFEDVKTRHKELAAYDVIIVYGETYNSPLAFAMSKSLIEMRYKRVHTLRGGLRAWESAGNSLATGDGSEDGDE
jgi:rhodanese-related sulfurtransferase